MVQYKQMGCKAVTITGGGEPTCHLQFNYIIKAIKQMGIEIGMVTNGWQLKRVPPEVLNCITWIRISLGDGRDLELNTPSYWENLESVISKSSAVDWAFSYVYAGGKDLTLLIKAIQFANKMNFTHVRVVEEILNPTNEMAFLERDLKEGAKLDCSRVIFQHRSNPGKGTQKCYISLLKPVVGADGFIYPCCGVQYAKDPPSLNYDKTMRMGEIKDIFTITQKQQFFDGSACVKCYYQNYNDLLAFMVSEIKHKRFV
jgi:MoaA/NifB/PqqE/SkfB family radical SAM enzyme